MNLHTTQVKRDEIKILIEKAKTHSRKELEIITRDIAPQKNSFLPSPAPRYIGRGRIERIARLSKEQEVKLDKALNLIKEEFKENISFERFLEIVSERVIKAKLKTGNKKALIFVQEKENKNIVTTSSIGKIDIDAKKMETGILPTLSKKIPNKIR